MPRINRLWPDRPARRATLLVLLLGLAAVLAAVLLQRTTSGDGAVSERPTFSVQRGALTISVLEAGTIGTQNQVTIKSEVEGKAAILALVEEGTLVEKGDLLIELDASRLQDLRIDQLILVQNAEAAFIHARENLEVTKNQAQSAVEKGELAHRFAGEDLKNYREGEFPKQLKEAESRITVTREELRRAEDQLEWSRVLFEENYISQTEFQADGLAAQKTRLELELALDSRDLLQNFTYGRRLAQLQSDVKQAEMALERARRKASADVVQARAELRARKSQFQREQGKLEKIKGQIEKARIYAPLDAMVVYATSARANWRGNVEPLAEGQEVRERQDLIYLPAAGAVMAEVKIHESSLTKVRVGLPVRLMVDALPGRIFHGRVASIAPLPDAASMWLNPDLKLYSTEIDLEGDGSELRTGMSCQAEIIVNHHDDVLSVPVQAVITVAGRSTVYLVKDDRIEPRAVEIGQDNNRMVHIISGLEVGAEVLLTPPLPATAEPESGDGGRAR